LLWTIYPPHSLFPFAPSFRSFPSREERIDMVVDLFEKIEVL
jgi:hypothetical protein